MDDCKTRKYLSNLEIIEVIQSYINETLYNYAVMIDGEWGCGKTHFVKNVLIPKLKEHEKKTSIEIKKEKFIYISLYGMKTIDELSKQIYMNVYLDDEKKKKGFSFGSSAVSIAFDILKTKGIEIKQGNVEDFLSQFLSLDKVVLFFDDLERCDIPINEVLGYINGFVEHQKMKVVIIANQKEIDKEFDKSNMELKYMVALNKNYYVNNNDKNSTFNSFNLRNNKDKSTEFSKEELDNRLKSLFTHQSEYEKVKEKLIGITIYYYPNLEETMKMILDEAEIGKELKSMMQDKISDYIDIMKNLKHYNIRTFQFYLSKMIFLYDKIARYLNIDTKEFLDYLIKYCFQICCSFKKGDINYQKHDNLGIYESNVFDISGLSFALQFRVKFADDYIVYSQFDETSVSKVIHEYNKKYSEKASDYNQVLSNLKYGWFEYTQKEVESLLNKVLGYLANNMYDLDDYVIIIDLFLSIQNIGFDSQYIEDMKKFMLHNIERPANYYQFDENYASMISNKDIKTQFQEIVEQLQTKMDDSFDKNQKNEVQEIISTETDWVNKIQKLAKKSGKYSSYSTINIFNYVGIDFLTSKIIDSTPKNLWEFRGLLKTLSDEMYKDSDYQAHLSQLYKTLYEESDEKPEDLIAKAHFQYLKKDLEGYMPKISQEKI